MKLSEYSPIAKQMICMIGPPGTGKSLIAASYARLGPLWMGNIDGRIMSVYQFIKAKAPELLPLIDFEVYKSNQFDKLADKLEGFLTKNPYTTLCVDPLLFLGNMLIEYGLDQRSQGSGKNKGRLEMPGPEEFGVESRGLHKVLDFGLMVKSHFILTAHLLESTYYTIGQPEPTVRKDVLVAGKKIAAAIPAVFDEVWYVENKPSSDVKAPPKRMVYLKPNGDYPLAKTARDKYLPASVDITDKLFFDVMKPYFDKEAADVPQTQPLG